MPSTAWRGCARPSPTPCRCTPSTWANVVNFWLRNLTHIHQPKAVYLSAWFVTDTIREVDWYPADPAVAKPDYTPFRSGADRPSTSEVLAELERAVAAQDPSRSMALVRSYQERTGERDALIRTLVHCAGKFQGDAHIFRNARSTIEEYQQNLASRRREGVLFQAWAHYVSFYKKRTLSTECYDLYPSPLWGRVACGLLSSTFAITVGRKKLEPPPTATTWRTRSGSAGAASALPTGWPTC